MTNLLSEASVLPKTLRKSLKPGLHKSHSLVAVVTLFNMVPPNISGSSKWNLLRVALLVPILLENFYTSSLKQKDGLSNNIV
jgi:hypothetical protein